MPETLTNRKNAPASNGQCVTVQLNATDSAKLANISVGDPATISSSSKVGEVVSIDLYGTSLKIGPKTEKDRMDSSSTPAVLATGETVTITT